MTRATHAAEASTDTRSWKVETASRRYRAVSGAVSRVELALRERRSDALIHRPRGQIFKLLQVKVTDAGEINLSPSRRRGNSVRGVVSDVM